MVDQTLGRGLRLRQYPEGPIIGTLREGDPLIVLYGSDIVNGLVWIEVMDEGFSRNVERAAESAEKIASDSHSQADGMSLEMVKAIVGSLGGQVWVQGKGAMGSTIALALPGIEGTNGR